MSSFDRFLAALLPSGLAQSAARRLLKATGVGHGGMVGQSGEMEAAERALAMARAGSRQLTLFDVGGNIGEWTLAAAKRWPDASIHVFEPSQRHLDELRRATAGLAGVSVNACALGREAGSATLYKDAEITGLASMTRRDLGHIGRRMELTETIAVDTLGAYCAAKGLSSIDFLKIDVEGHELDVLEGGRTLFSERAVAAVQFEFGGCNVDTRTFYRDFHGFFADAGYLIHRIAPGGRLVPLPRYNEFSEQFMTTNFIAVRREARG